MIITELDKPKRRGRPCKSDWERVGRSVSFRLPDTSWLELIKDYAHENRYDWSQALREIFTEGMRSEGLI